MIPMILQCRAQKIVLNDLPSPAMQLTIMHATVFSILIPIGIAIWRYSQLEYEAKWLFYMLLPVAANQFLSVWWVHYIEPNNLPFYYGYILLEFIFLCWIYHSYLHTFRYRWAIALLGGTFVLYYLVKFGMYPHMLFEYSTHDRAIEGVLILLFAGTYFFEVYRRQEILHLQKTSGFWIGMGLILYFSSTLMIFLFSEVIFEQELSIFQSIWAIHALITVMLYLSFSIAFLCKKMETTS